MLLITHHNSTAQTCTTIILQYTTINTYNIQSHSIQPAHPYLEHIMYTIHITHARFFSYLLMTILGSGAFFLAAAGAIISEKFSSVPSNGLYFNT